MQDLDSSLLSDTADDVAVVVVVVLKKTGKDFVPAAKSRVGIKVERYLQQYLNFTQITVGRCR